MDYDKFVEDFNKKTKPELSIDQINDFFRKSCNIGHLEIARWLWEISEGKINISANNGYAFKYSCANGHLETARWLWEISRYCIDIHADNEYAFRISCANGHLEIASWLCEISDYYIDIHDIKFKISCEYNYFKVAAWLCKFSEHLNSIRKYNYNPFKIIYTNDNLVVAESLWKISNLKIYNIKPKIKYNYKLKLNEVHIHIKHYYYKPCDGPGYLNAIIFC